MYKVAHNPVPTQNESHRNKFPLAGGPFLGMKKRQAKSKKIIRIKIFNQIKKICLTDYTYCLKVQKLQKVQDNKI